MATYGASERSLFDEQSVVLYDEMVVAGGLPGDDPRLAEDGEQRPAFDLLVSMGLVQWDRDADRWVPEDPASVQSRVVGPLTTEGSRLIEESSQWARTFQTLTQTWRRSAAPSSRGPVTYLYENAINPFLTALVAEAEEECLTAQPQTGRDAQTLAAAALRDTEMLERGTRMRTLYQHSARRSSVTHQYVSAVTARGAEVRTLDEFFNRMIVIDRKVAVIPGAEDLTAAVVVREPSVVAYLVDIFERTWERARPFTNKDVSMMREIAAEQRAMTIRMLIEGHADPSSAKRVGVSPRTYAGYVADLKREFEVETRFQLGYAMGTAGVSGEEAVELDRD